MNDAGAKPQYSYNFFYCFNGQRRASLCANDCPGVDPNAVVVGGEVAILSVAVASSIGIGIHVDRSGC